MTNVPVRKYINLFNKNLKSLSEDELIKLSKKGNDDSFEELMKIYKDYLYKMAFLYVKNEHDALDVCQETILNAYLGISKLKNTTYFKTWITKILINIVHNKNRYDNRFQNISVEDITLEISYEDIEVKLDLYDVIDTLEDKYKTPIILQYFYDLPISNIAKIMECNENTIKSNIRRGKMKMYEQLKGDKYE